MELNHKVVSLKNDYMEYLSKVETPLGTVYKLSENLIQSVIKCPRVNDVEVLKEHVRLVFSEYGQDIYYLSDIRQVQYTSLKARRYLAEHVKVRATALLVTKGSTLLLAKIFLSFAKPTYPTEIFRDREKAILWLEEQRAMASQ